MKTEIVRTKRAVSIRGRGGFCVVCRHHEIGMTSAAVVAIFERGSGRLGPSGWPSKQPSPRKGSSTAAKSTRRRSTTRSWRSRSGRRWAPDSAGRRTPDDQQRPRPREVRRGTGYAGVPEQDDDEQERRRSSQRFERAVETPCDRPPVVGGVVPRPDGPESPMPTTSCRKRRASVGEKTTEVATRRCVFLPPERRRR